MILYKNKNKIFNLIGILPEALRTKCARCSRQQLEGGLRVITKLYYDYPIQYNRLRSKWDPTGEYHRRFEEYLRGLQFNTINSDTVTPANTYQNTPSKQPPIFASASSNNQNVVPTNLPNNLVCMPFYFFKINFFFFVQIKQ